MGIEFFIKSKVVFFISLYCSIFVPNLAWSNACNSYLNSQMQFQLFEYWITNSRANYSYDYADNNIDLLRKIRQFLVREDLVHIHLVPYSLETLRYDISQRSFVIFFHPESLERKNRYGHSVKSILQERFNVVISAQRPMGVYSISPSKTLK